MKAGIRRKDYVGWNKQRGIGKMEYLGWDKKDRKEGWGK